MATDGEDQHGDHTRREPSPFTPHQQGLFVMDMVDPRLREDNFYPNAPQQSFEHSTHPTGVVGSATSQQEQVPPQTTVFGYSELPHQQGDAYSPQEHTPDTPQSVDARNVTPGAPTADGGSSQAAANASNDQKRARACEACRGLKVKCELDSEHPERPCRRCVKSQRNCVITQPTRKRQKKTDNRVAELEGQMKELHGVIRELQQHSRAGSFQTAVPTAPFNAYQQVTNGQGAGYAGYPSPYGDRPDVARPLQNDWQPDTQSLKAPDWQPEPPASRPPIVMAGQRRRYSEFREGQLESPVSATPRRSLSGAKQQERHDTLASAKPNASHEYADVIDRGIISVEVANQLFTRYTTEMAPILPAVVFPPGTTAAEIRKSKPTLFLSILIAGAGTDFVEFQKKFNKEIMQVYADRIVARGEETLEIIQALLVSTIWYYPPDHFEELKFYQLIHFAAVMGIDLGLYRRNKSLNPQRPFQGLWRDRKHQRPEIEESSSIEARRTWLSCYLICCSAAVGWRRPNLIRWDSYMAECVQLLENSPEALQSDAYLCQFIKCQRIAEEVGEEFQSASDVVINITDPHVQDKLKEFEKKLERWSDDVPPNSQTLILKMSEHVINMYMHEIALNVEEIKAVKDENGSSFGATDQPNRALSPAHIRGLSICLTSAEGIMESFLSLDITTIRGMPVMHFVRIAYAVVTLFKIHALAGHPSSELSKVIDKENIKLELYLDRLHEKFQVVAAGDKCRPATKLIMALSHIKSWIHRSKTCKSQHGASSDKQPQNVDALRPRASVPPQTQAQQQKVQTYSPANTPLQLLSEVATGSSNQPSRPDSRTQYPSSTQGGEWQPAQLPQSYTYGDAPAQQSSYHATYPVDNNISVPAVEMVAFGADNWVQPHDNFQSNEGDFGQFMSDDAFFGGMFQGLSNGAFDFDFEYPYGGGDSAM